MSDQLNNMTVLMQTMGKSAREAARVLAISSTTAKNQALLAIAKSLRENASLIQKANQQDLEGAKENQMPPAFLDRLLLNPERIQAMARGLETIAEQADPVGRILAKIKRPNGIEITRKSIPIGVLGVIYESRPNVTVDAAGLSLKSGNAVILRGGSESYHSATAIMLAVQAGLKAANLPLASVQMVPTPDRLAVEEMLKLDDYIDVIIPRGGQKLIEYISSASRIPLFKHAAGICHTYVHRTADLEKARKIILNAKMRRTGICGATEVLLIDQEIVASHLPFVLEDLLAAGCEIRGDAAVIAINSQVNAATPADYDTEFLDAILAVKAVTNLEAAIQHIAKHGTQHTDAIITEDHNAAEKFLQAVDSAIVMHNTSTQFADGGEFGMGAEIGIATGKLHARGPVGLEQLTTFKYQVRGDGQIRSSVDPSPPEGGRG